MATNALGNRICTSHIFQLAQYGISASQLTGAQKSLTVAWHENGMSCCYMTPHQFRFTLFLL